MELLNLPDELVLLIFKRVSTNDLLSLSKTCKRFMQLTTDWRLLSTLNFRYETALHGDFLKAFLGNRARAEVVTTIDLTSCYWLTSSFVLNILLRLQNVVNVLVADTALSCDHLKQALSNLPMVKRLSWSWQKGSKAKGMKAALHNLTFLYLCLPNLDNNLEISSFLAHCVELQELWVVNVGVERKVPPIQGDCNLPQVRKILMYRTEGLVIESNASLICNWVPYVVFGQGSCTDMVMFQAACFSEAVHRCILNANHLSKLNVIDMEGSRELEEFLQQFPVLTALHVPLPDAFPEDLFSKNIKLEELCLSCTCANHTSSKNFCSSVIRCPLLKRLVLPIQALVCDAAPVKTPSTSYSGSRTRVSRVTTSVPDSVATPFRLMVHQTPLMEEFEVGTICSSHQMYRLPETLQWDIHSLASIEKWKNLSSLTLANLPFFDGKIFAPILKGCKSLRKLRIWNLGPRAKCIYSNDLFDAIAFGQTLQDFDWEQSNVGNTYELWNSLAHIKTLERVSVRSDGLSDINEEAILHFLSNCLQVVWLLAITGATIATNVSLRRRIYERWSKTRPVLRVQLLSFRQNLEEMRARVPSIHSGEMWLSRSRIAGRPSSSDSFLSFRVDEPIPWAPHV